MRIKSEKGFTLIDIGTAIVVIFIFITLISILIYQFNSSYDEIKIESEAVELAIKEIEKIKMKSIENLESELNEENIEYGNNEENAKLQEIKEGFYRQIIIEDYHDIDPTKEQDIVKRIKVQVKYKFKKQEHTIELATLISK